MNRVKREFAGYGDSRNLMDLLISSATTELRLFYYYTILNVNIVHPDDGGLRLVTETIRTEDRNHFDTLVSRIYGLGGKLPYDMKEFHVIPTCPYIALSTKPDTRSVVKTLLDIKQGSISGYNTICNMTLGEDRVTYDLASRILREEKEHAFWFFEFLDESVSQRYMELEVASPSYMYKAS